MIGPSRRSRPADELRRQHRGRVAPGRLLCRANPQGRKPCGVARDTANLRRDQFRLLFFGAAHDIQSENPSLDCVIAPFCRCVIGMKTFGASAPLKELLRKYGFEPERITEVAKELLGKGKNK